MHVPLTNKKLPSKLIQEFMNRTSATAVGNTAWDEINRCTSGLACPVNKS
jgi:hypothetical protein